MKWKRLPRPTSLSTQIRPPMRSDQARGDGQAQARAAVAARRGSCRPARTSRRWPLVSLRGMPIPVSATVKCSSDVVSRWDSRVTSRLTSPVLGELDGVADQVDDDLAQAVVVADHHVGHFGMDEAGQFQPLLVRPDGKRLHRVAEAFPQVEHARNRGRAFPASILEKSRMSLITESRASPESLTVWRNSRCWRESWLFRTSSVMPMTAFKRRADLVAHVGQEGALGAAGGFCLCPGLLQRRVRAGQLGRPLLDPHFQFVPRLSQFPFVRGRCARHSCAG